MALACLFQPARIVGGRTDLYSRCTSIVVTSNLAARQFRGRSRAPSIVWWFFQLLFHVVDSALKNLRQFNLFYLN